MKPEVEAAYDAILEHGCVPLTLGGDHTITLPILRAMARRHGPLGVDFSTLTLVDSVVSDNTSGGSASVRRR